MATGASGMPEFTPEAIEAGRRLFAQNWDFVRGVVDLKGLPPEGPPEIALAGRSNVGKSSLLNALTGRKQLARTSHTPGRTQELNVFALGDTLRIVDMPGYGYAEAPKEKVDQWTGLIFDYLRGRVTLRRVFVLIDARHGLKSTDTPALDLLDKAAVTYQIVLTKADALKPPGQRKAVEAVLAATKKRPAAFPEVLLTSSRDAIGIAEMRATIAGIAAQ